MFIRVNRHEYSTAWLVMMGFFRPQIFTIKDLCCVLEQTRIVYVTRMQTVLGYNYVMLI